MDERDLFGRADELERLRRLLVGGESCVVRGRAGVGKSALLRAAIGRDAVVIRGLAALCTRSLRPAALRTGARSTSASPPPASFGRTSTPDCLRGRPWSSTISTGVILDSSAVLEEPGHAATADRLRTARRDTCRRARRGGRGHRRGARARPARCRRCPSARAARKRPGGAGKTRHRARWVQGGGGRAARSRACSPWAANSGRDVLAAAAGADRRSPSRCRAPIASPSAALRSPESRSVSIRAANQGAVGSEWSSSTWAPMVAAPCATTCSPMLRSPR